LVTTAFDLSAIDTNRRSGRRSLTSSAEERLSTCFRAVVTRSFKIGFDRLKREILSEETQPTDEVVECDSLFWKPPAKRLPEAGSF